MFVRAVATPLRSVRRAPTTLMGVRMKSKVATQTTTTVATEHDERAKLRGDFVRPQVDGDYLVSGKETRIAEPQTPPEVSEYGVSQAPNYFMTWSEDQRPKSEAMKGPRFEQIAMEFQPAPPSAMELISNVPVQFTTKRVVSCDGGMCTKNTLVLTFRRRSSGTSPCIHQPGMYYARYASNRRTSRVPKAAHTGMFSRLIAAVFASRSMMSTLTTFPDRESTPARRKHRRDLASVVSDCIRP